MCNHNKLTVDLKEAASAVLKYQLDRIQAELDQRDSVQVEVQEDLVLATGKLKYDVYYTEDICFPYDYMPEDMVLRMVKEGIKNSLVVKKGTEFRRVKSCWNGFITWESDNEHITGMDDNWANEHLEDISEVTEGTED